MFVSVHTREDDAERSLRVFVLLTRMCLRFTGQEGQGICTRLVGTGTRGALATPVGSL